MSKDRDIAVYVATYDSAGPAEADLDAIEQLHKDELIGTFDAVVVDNVNGKPHILKRLSRPMVRVIPEQLGFGPLSRKELKQAADQLTGSQAGLIVVGEPTFDKAVDRAVTHATKTVKHVIGSTADELARDMKKAATS